MDKGMFVPLVLPLLSWPLASVVMARTSPRLASWLLAAGALVLAGGGTVVLALLAAFEHRPWLGLAAGALLVAVAARLAVATARCVRWMREVRAAAGESDTELVVVDGAPMAIAVPFHGGRIVVSRALLTTLGDGEVCALLAHERAHLRGRHHWFLAAAGLAVALNPLVRPVRTALEFTLERWADEGAARSVGDRKLVATAVAKAALVSKAGPVLAATGGPVPRRVSALLRAPTRSWRLGVAVVLAVVLCSGSTVVEAVADAATSTWM
ncbi:M56 family metallopeptidase [Amycolatopsis sp. cg5]|uniref:M56 family metallopeptidase n=1 Tax=Amycolatopsis sp. cg5 TaxID=3238802 RepID=UPI003524BC8D